MSTLDLTNVLNVGDVIYSPMFGNVKVVNVYDSEFQYPITIESESGKVSFTREGKYTDTQEAECLLFPSNDIREWKLNNNMIYKLIEEGYVLINEHPVVSEEKYELWKKFVLDIIKLSFDNEDQQMIISTIYSCEINRNETSTNAKITVICNQLEHIQDTNSKQLWIYD